MIWFGQASRTPVTLDFFAFFAQTGAIIRHFQLRGLRRWRWTRTSPRSCGSWRPGSCIPSSAASPTGTSRPRPLPDLRDRRLRGKAALRIGRPTARSSIPTGGVRS